MNTTILAVDDNPDILMTVESFLSGQSFNVETASSAVEALGIIRKGRVPNILLSDIVMPGAIDGIELARIVSKSHPQVGVLLMTGWSYNDSHGFPVITKPFELDALSAWISDHLRTKKAN